MPAKLNSYVLPGEVVLNTKRYGDTEICFTAKRLIAKKDEEGLVFMILFSKITCVSVGESDVCIYCGDDITMNASCNDPKAAIDLFLRISERVA